MKGVRVGKWWAGLPAEQFAELMAHRLEGNLCKGREIEVNGRYMIVDRVDKEKLVLLCQG